MAVDYFLKIDGIDGESADSKHKDEIDVDSWSWGASQTGVGAGGGGGAAGAPGDRRAPAPPRGRADVAFSQPAGGTIRGRTPGRTPVLPGARRLGASPG
jgi:hypothetical protein